LSVTAPNVLHVQAAQFGATEVVGESDHEVSHDKAHVLPQAAALRIIGSPA